MVERVREERFALAEMERQRQKILIDNDDMQDVSLRAKKMNRQSSPEVCEILIFFLLEFLYFLCRQDKHEKKVTYYF